MVKGGVVLIFFLIKVYLSAKGISETYYKYYNDHDVSNQITRMFIRQLIHCSTKERKRPSMTVRTLQGQHTIVFSSLNH